MKKRCIWGIVAGLLISAQALAQDYVEQGRRVIYLRESGSGAEGKLAAIKLDNQDSLEAGCFEDILVLDASTPAGKVTYKELEALQASGTMLKFISYSRDEEGDCHLEKIEK